MAVETTNGASGGGDTGATGGAGAADGGASVGGAAPTAGGATGGQGAAQAGSAEAAALAAAATGASAVGAYAPNFKYKVTAPAAAGGASKLEKEIPEWAKPFLTSADLEKNVKELFEKSEGLEAVKQHRDLLTQENEQMRTQWAPIVQNVNALAGHLQRGDFDSFFESLNIPEQTILKYALYRLQLRENPQQMQSHEQMRTLQNQNLQLQQQLQTSNGGYENLAIQQRTMQLDMQLARPETLPVATAFDAKIGTPGAFRNECIRRGQMYAAQKVDASAEQVVSEVLQLLGWQGQVTLAPPVAMGAGATAGGAGGTAPKPTFPSLQGKGTSPVQKAITSTAQLRELAKQKRA